MTESWLKRSSLPTKTTSIRESTEPKPSQPTEVEAEEAARVSKSEENQGGLDGAADQRNEQKEENDEFMQQEVHKVIMTEEIVQTDELEDDDRLVVEIKVGNMLAGSEQQEGRQICHSRIIARQVGIITIR